MKIRRLTNDLELEEYRAGFTATLRRRAGSDDTKAATRELPLEYLRESRVYGAFDREGKMQAGYTLGVTMPFRLLDFVPDEKREGLEVPFGLSWQDCCEITVMWKSPAVSPLFMSAQLWPHAMRAVLASGRRILLGHNQNPKLDRFYTAMGPATIYSGPSTYGLPSRLFAYSRPHVVAMLATFYLGVTPLRALRGIVRRRKT